MKSHLLQVIFPWLLAGMLAFLPACQREAAPSDEEPATEETAGETEDEADEPEHFHSPFVLELDGGKFDTVSFKDVGLEREEDGPDQMLLEVVAESLAYELSNRADTDYEAEVVYDERAVDPTEHTQCELDHLYVDLWQGEHPERWGYSLWSGCNELHNFAWNELPAEAADDRLTAHVSPLTEGIVDSLEEAIESDCFQKHC